MTITLGNDIARYQGDVNYDVFKNNSQFVIVKASEGVGYTDLKFSRNQIEARRVGLLLGYYHFARPDLGNTPEAEADYFLKTIGALRDGELLCLDYECANQKQEHVDWCRKWLDRVYSATKVRPFIYLNQSQVKSFNWQTVVDGNFALWIAAYTKDPYKNDFATGAFKTAAMQQWTNAQSVPGISGNVDGNVFFGDLATLKKYGYKTPVAQPPQETVITDENTLIKIGNLDGVDVGNWRLKDIRQSLINLSKQITDQKIEIQNKETEISGLVSQVNGLKERIGLFDNMVSAIKKAFGF